MSVPKWTDERTNTLVKFVGDESPVTQATVAEAAEVLETSARSISSKLRKMEYEVEKAGAHNQRAFTDAQAATLEAFVTDNSGLYTYAQIAKNFEGGFFNPKQIQGKILSMELTEHVAPAPKPESVRTYTPEEEATFIEMTEAGAFMEEIAEALGKPMNSARGKALSLLRLEQITEIPKQKETKGSTRRDPLADLGDVSGMTVEEIAAAITEVKGSEQSVRGVKTMLTRRGLVASDWDGAGRKEKAAK